MHLISVSIGIHTINLQVGILAQMIENMDKVRLVRCTLLDLMVLLGIALAHGYSAVVGLKHSE